MERPIPTFELHTATDYIGFVPSFHKVAPMSETPQPWETPLRTARLVLADGSVLEGEGFGAEATVGGEVCFNTAMTGYQEILTDPSYAGQIVTFTFPHIGNVGANDDDLESLDTGGHKGAIGCVVRAPVTGPSNFRAREHLDAWLAERGIACISGVDTRALTTRIREGGMPNAVLAHRRDGAFDLDDLVSRAKALPSMQGLDLVPGVAGADTRDWHETRWVRGRGYGRLGEGRYKVVAVDYGAKRNILRLLAEAGCEVTVVPAETSAEDVLALKPDGVFLSNGPGDPAATAEYAAPMIRRIIDSGVPTFGICLGHQLLALTLGARTVKMRQGHHGANHPVMDSLTGKVEIVSMNHGFAVDRDSLPASVRETHVSLFDGSNAGLMMVDRPVFSVQHHPEASPGPQDSHYLFARFVQMMDEHRRSGVTQAAAAAAEGKREKSEESAA